MDSTIIDPIISAIGDGVVAHPTHNKEGQLCLGWDSTGDNTLDMMIPWDQMRDLERLHVINIRREDRQHAPMGRAIPPIYHIRVRPPVILRGWVISHTTSQNSHRRAVKTEALRIDSPSMKDHLQGRHLTPRAALRDLMSWACDEILRSAVAVPSTVRIERGRATLTVDYRRQVSV